MKELNDAREGLDSREAQITQRETSLAGREGQLKTREELVTKASADLADQLKKAQEAADTRVEDAKKGISAACELRLQQQEGRFKAEREELAGAFDQRVVEDSRELLVVATSRIFGNLALLFRALDLNDVMVPIEASQAASEAAAAFASKFDLVEVDKDEDGGEGDGEAEGVQKHATAGAGTSGGAEA